MLDKNMARHSKDVEIKDSFLSNNSVIRIIISNKIILNTADIS